jgi:predicted nucleotidyltransferase
MIKGDYKIIYYFGYPKKLPISFELYNLRDDADELNNLFAANQVMASRMKEELLDALDASNRSIRQVK